jgi:ABC-type transport system involved in cytochrome c biogenesis permease subunit
MFICFLLYLSYLVLRPALEEPTQRALISAVFNIFAFADVPIVWYSIEWFRTQHPQPVVGGGGSIDPRMLHVLLMNWLAFLCFAYLVCWSRYRLEIMKRLHIHDVVSLVRYAIRVGLSAVPWSGVLGVPVTTQLADVHCGVGVANGSATAIK